MDEKKSERKVLLDRAAECVLKERNASYGDPTQDFQRIAEMWSIMFERMFTPHDVALAMICLKLSRLSWNPGQMDSWVDIAGYAACGWECAIEEAHDKPVQGGCKTEDWRING